MKRVTFILLLILFLIPNKSVQAYWDEDADLWTIEPIQYYNPNNGEIVCWDACWHEVGHKLDKEIMDRVSESDEFQEQIINFLYMELMYHKSPSHPMAHNIFLFPGFFTDWEIFEEDTGRWAGYKWGGYSELYADILYWAEGDIEKVPENLRQFYDIETAIQMYLDLDN